MSIATSSKEILDIAENLKSVVTKCKIENSLALEILSNAKSNKSHQVSSIHSQSLKDSGEVPQNSENKNSGKTNLHSKTSHEEHLSMSIKNAAKENLKLRESNVKLKQESKVQDKKIRDLNRKIMLLERDNHENESQKILIRDLKCTMEKKAAEIRLLKQNLENVRVLLKKEQNKTKLFQERKKKPPKSKVNQELKSKVEELLEQINVLLETAEQKKDKSWYGDKNVFEKILNTLKKLMTHYYSPNEDEQDIFRRFTASMGDNFDHISGVHVSKSDMSIQTSDNEGLEDKESGSSLDDKNEYAHTDDSQDLENFS